MFLWSLLFLTASTAVGRDCNRNGNEDALDIESASSEDCDQNGVPDECEGLPLQLGNGRATYAVTKTAMIVKAGDLNGDGLHDLVTISVVNNSVLSVLNSCIRA